MIPGSKDYPKDICDKAERLAGIRVDVAKLLLEERKRCAQILLTKHENHPQDGVMWDSTYYDLYEEIMGW